MAAIMYGKPPPTHDLLYPAIPQETLPRPHHNPWSEFFRLLNDHLHDSKLLIDISLCDKFLFGFWLPNRCKLALRFLLYNGSSKLDGKLSKQTPQTQYIYPLQKTTNLKYPEKRVVECEARHQETRKKLEIAAADRDRFQRGFEEETEAVDKLNHFLGGLLRQSRVIADSILEGRTVEPESTLLIPLHPPTGLDDSHRPPLFQAYKVPDAPQGWRVGWIG